MTAHYGPACAEATMTCAAFKGEDEVAWGWQVVQAWNAAHPTEKVTAQEIPAGQTSEAVISASITAGNAPCLIYNTSPAAVPNFQAQGGLVPLDDFADGTGYVTTRSDAAAAQYKSPDGKFYQLPWKSNPGTYAEFLATAQKLVSSGAAKYAIFPSPSSQFFQSWFDFYPMYAAATGQQLVVDRKSTFDSDQGRAVAGLWQQLYAQNLAGKEAYTGDAPSATRRTSPCTPPAPNAPQPGIS
jgi:multiple sugar transport system substrate-binding protein